MVSIDATHGLEGNHNEPGCNILKDIAVALLDINEEGRFMESNLKFWY